MNRSKRIIGIFLIILSIAGLITWEKWGKDQFLYDDILVLRENVKKGTIITEDMLTGKKMKVDEDCLLFQEKAEIVGKQAASFIHQGVPLFGEYVQEPNLSPDEGKGTFVLALPEEWILSKPETLSRGDKVFFFCGRKLVTAAFVAVIGEDGSAEVIVTQAQAAELSDAVGGGGKLVMVYQ